MQINALKAETQRLTDGDSEDSDDGESPQIHSYGEHGDHHGFVLGYKSSDADLSKLHPLPSQIPFIWQVYVENVDPLIKILHIPTMTKVIREARTNMANISHGMEALLFSIYYAAITSMEPDEVSGGDETLPVIPAMLGQLGVSPILTHSTGKNKFRFRQGDASQPVSLCLRASTGKS